MKKVMKNKKVIAMMVVGLVAIFLATSGVVASPLMFGDDPPVASTISYQGLLRDSGGNPLDGTYGMQFQFYDSATGGSQVGTPISKSGVPVTNGLFSVKLDVNQATFNGQGLWLEVMVEGETLSPRQEILPVPYALSIKPGAVISDTNSYVELNRYTTKGVPRYSCGVYAESEGEGIFVDRYYGVYGRGSSAGVYGQSIEGGYGGYFDGRGDDGCGIYAMGGQNGYAADFRGNVIIRDGDLCVEGDNVRIQDGDLWVKGDVDYDGALIGAFPRPLYDSGWVFLNPGEDKYLYHNILGHVDNYVVDMQVRNEWGIHNFEYGTDSDCCAGWYSGGAYYEQLNNYSIRIVRAEEDEYSPEIRIRIWYYQ